MLNELEKKIYELELSTKTTFPQFVPVHNSLRMKYSWYYKWHSFRYASLVHIMFLLIFSFGSFFGIYSNFIPNSFATEYGSKTLTSQAEWEAGTLTNIDTTSSAGSMKIDETGTSEISGGTFSYSSCAVIPQEPSVIHDNDDMSSLSLGCSGDYVEWNLGSSNIISQISTLITEVDTDMMTSPEVSISYWDGDSWVEAARSTALGYSYETHEISPPITTDKLRYVLEMNPGGSPDEALDFFETDVFSDAQGTHLSTPTQLDAGEHDSLVWTTFAPTATIPENTSVKFRFRSSDDASNWGSWTSLANYAASIDIATLLGDTDKVKRYLQVETTLANTDGASTPTFDAYTANYEYEEAAGGCSDGIQNGDETGVDCGGSCSACPSDEECEVGETEQSDGITLTDKDEWQDQTYNNKIIDTETSPGSVKLLQGKDGYMSGYFGFCNGTGVGTYTNTLNSWDSLFFQFPIDVENFPDNVTSARLKLYMTHGFWAGGTPVDPRYVPYSLSTISSQWLENPMTCPPAGGATFNSATLDMLQFNECYGQMTGMMEEGGCFSDFWPNTYYSFELGGGTPEEVGSKWAGFGFRLSATHLDGFQFYMREQSVDYPPVIEINFANGETWNVNLPIQTGTQSGTILSAPTQLDGGENFSGWTTFSPNATIPANTSVSFRFRTSADATNWGEWSESSNYASSIDISGLTQYRYLQVETTLANTDGASTPILNSYTTNYSYCLASDPTCSDGIQNGDETGIDCGGSCSACEPEDPDPTCDDGVQNGTETGVDCGGVCSSCPIEPSCFDGIKNQDETAVDCGGVCTACPIPESCLDGIENQDETGVDCGGVCSSCPIIPTCSDKEQNQGESGVDCGGPCPACPVIPTCNDGIMNQNETDIDCGGSCPACIIDDQTLSLEIQPSTAKTKANEQTEYVVSAYLGLDKENVTAETNFEYSLKAGGNIISINGNKVTVKAGSKISKFYDSLFVVGRYRNLTANASASLEVYQNISREKTDPCGVFCQVVEYIKEKIKGLTGSSSDADIFNPKGLMLAFILALLNLVGNLASLIRSVRLYSAFLKGKDKRMDKSVVYDSQTGSPLEGVRVELIDKEHNILEAMAVSDKDGKFSLNLSPGKKYIIKTDKENYHQIMFSDTEDKVGLHYENNYTGEEFEAKDNELLFIKNIPLKLLKTEDIASKIKQGSSLTRILITLNVILYFAGLIYSLIVLYIDSSIFNYIIMDLYALTAIIYIIRYVFIDGRTHGSVIHDLAPVELALVRAVNANSGKLVKTAVSDIKGRYSLALPKGEYIIYAAKHNLRQEEDIRVKVKSSYEPRKETIRMALAGQVLDPQVIKGDDDGRDENNTSSGQPTPSNSDEQRENNNEQPLVVEYKPQVNDEQQAVDLAPDSGINENNPLGKESNIAVDNPSGEATTNATNQVADSAPDNAVQNNKDNSINSADDIIDNYYHNKDS